jgi:hypothetical protein
LKQIEAQIEAGTPEPETQIPAQELDSGEGNRDRGKVQLQWFDVARTLVCEIVLGQLPRQKEERPEGAPKFSVEVYKVSEQLVKIFCDSGWLELRILAADRAIRTAGCGSAVAASCAGRLSCLSLSQGDVPFGRAEQAASGDAVVRPDAAAFSRRFALGAPQVAAWPLTRNPNVRNCPFSEFPEGPLLRNMTGSSESTSRTPL